MTVAELIAQLQRLDRTKGVAFVGKDVDNNKMFVELGRCEELVDYVALTDDYSEPEELT